MDISEFLILVAMFIVGVMAGIGACMAFGIRGFQNPFSRAKKTVETGELTTALAASFTNKESFPEVDIPTPLRFQPSILDKPEGEYFFSSEELREMQMYEVEDLRSHLMLLAERRGLAISFAEHFGATNGIRLRWRTEK